MGCLQYCLHCLLYLLWAVIFIHSQNNSCQLEGQIRLRGGRVNHEGRVELCRAGVWGTICDTDWDEYEAMVVCRQLGFQETDAIPRRNSEFQQGTGTIHETKYSCNGEESLLIQCDSEGEECDHDDEAGVFCKRAQCSHGDIQLTVGSPENSGRVEVCLYQQWTSVFDDHWSSQDAGVACEQLGYVYSGATPTMITTNITFRPAGLQFLNCTGKESKLIDCPTTVSQSLLASNLNGVFAAGVHCLNSTYTTTTSVGSMDTYMIYTTLTLTRDFSISSKISRWVAAGICTGLFLSIVLLLLLVWLLAVYYSRLRVSKQHQIQNPPDPQEENIELHENESYAFPPLSVGGPPDETENPCYEQILPMM